MTRIKFCGMKSLRDIEAANRLRPDYVGFVFAPGSRRQVSPKQAEEMKRKLRPDITAVGVFVRENPETIAELFRQGVIDMAQLHGGEDEAYVEDLRARTDCPLIQAFRMDTEEDVKRAERSTAEVVLLDSGTGGTGHRFDWQLLAGMTRPYILAGGLDADRVRQALRELRPWGVDVSSGIETEGRKDPEKMTAFAAAVREEDEDDE